ncbi:MAG: ROK family protein [Bacteroidota bacterium]|nr:ROK family protein [Bacteroidota bacterium]
MKYFIGVELGVKNIIVGVVDKYGRLIRKESIPTQKERHYTEIVKDVSMLITTVLDKEGIEKKYVKYVGVGSPGTPNVMKGTIVRNYTLNFHNTPIKTELEKYINLPVIVENDANCAALAESVAGAAEDIDYSVLIRVGTGLGGGIIINNKIYSGFNYAGAELGHMVVSLNGEKCTCGRNGCWEAYASATALIKQTKAAAEKNPDSLINTLVEGDYSKLVENTVFEAAKKGDQTAKDVVSRYLLYLAEGIVNIINILQPEVIIIGGEISKEGDALIKPLKELVAERVYCQEVRQTEFKTAQMGGASVVIGAAMLGLYKNIAS